MDQKVVLREKPKFSAQITSEGFQKLITNTLQDQGKAQRFTAKIISAVATNPALQECEASTIVAGALLGESLGLNPAQQMGEYYLVPFKKKVKRDDGTWDQITTAAFVLGYHGYYQLALRSNQYQEIDVRDVHSGEYIGMDEYTGKHRFRFSEELEMNPVIGYMARFKMQNGFEKVIYWSREKMIAHADQYSQAFRAEDYKRYINNEIPQNELYKYSSFWYKNFDAMARKTMLRQLISKWGVMSIDYQYDGREIKVDPVGNGSTVENIFVPGDTEVGIDGYIADNKEQIAEAAVSAGVRPEPQNAPKTIDMNSL